MLTTSGKDQCYKLHLPKHDHVTIFLDLEAGSKPTVARQSAKGVSNKELAILDLGSLGMIPVLFRSTLCVMNSAYGAMVVSRILSHKDIVSLGSATYTSFRPGFRSCVSVSVFRVIHLGVGIQR